MSLKGYSLALLTLHMGEVKILVFIVLLICFPLGWKRVTFLQPKKQTAKLEKRSKSLKYKAFLPA